MNIKKIMMLCFPLVLAACGQKEFKSSTPSLTMDVVPERSHVRTLLVKGNVQSNNLDDLKVNVRVGDKLFPAKVSNGKYEALVSLQAGQNEIIASIENQTSDASIQKSLTHYGETLGAGAAHSGAIWNGTLYMWGKNNLGQAGNGQISDGELPFRLTNVPQLVALSFNANYSMGIDKNGQVYAWGDGTQGQMAKSPEDLQKCHEDRFGSFSFCRKMPEMIAGLSNIVQVQAGGGHVLALDRDGHVYAWGENSNDQVSAAASEMVTAPMKLSLPEKMVALAGQGQTSYAIGENGKVYAWGDNEVGQLGQGDTLPRETVVVVNLPHAAVQIAAGGSHALALLENGDIYAWGENFQNQVGPKDDNDPDTEEPSPIKVMSIANVKQLLAGGNTSGFINEAGQIFIWGLYSDEMEDVGGFNVPVSKELERPTQVLPNFTVNRLVFGALHQVAESKNTVFTWGWNTNRSLGSDLAIDNWMQPLPHEISLP